MTKIIIVGIQNQSRDRILLHALPGWLYILRSDFDGTLYRYYYCINYLNRWLRQSQPFVFEVKLISTYNT